MNRRVRFSWALGCWIEPYPELADRYGVRWVKAWMFLKGEWISGPMELP